MGCRQVADTQPTTAPQRICQWASGRSTIPRLLALLPAPTPCPPSCPLPSPTDGDSLSPSCPLVGVGWRWPNKHATSKYLGMRLEATIKDNPDVSILKLKNSILRKCGVSVGYKKVMRAKKVAMDKIEGQDAVEYGLLWDYCETVRTRNPGSKLLLRKTPDSDPPIFERMYFSLAAMKVGFISGCRPLISRLDGCLLKTPHSGQLLCEVGRDGNDNLFPIALAVVPIENRETWTWFVSELLDDIGEVEDNKWTFISDRQKALLETIKALAPGCAHRARSHFESDYKSDVLVNNLCESFNNYILEARERPIISMFEWIRNRLTTRIQGNTSRSTDKAPGVTQPADAPGVTQPTDVPSSDTISFMDTNPIQTGVEGHVYQGGFGEKLKNSLIFDSSSSTKLVYWNQNVDCCNWNGIACDSSGHVISLELDNESILGGIENSTTLFSFQYLERLNLAYNSFFNTQFPEQLVNLTRLAYLNFSNAGFTGQIPHEISKIRSLVSLDLSCQSQRVLPLKLEDPNLEILVQNLTSLKELYLDGVEISNHTNDWWGSLSESLPNLRNLSLRNCDLSGSLNPTLTQLQSLTVLRLDRNNLSTIVPDFFANFRNLTVLTLRFCYLQGSFPETIFQVPSLQYLDLSNNTLLKGKIPEFPFRGSFRTIILRSSSFSGSLPNSISNLSMLSIIDLSNCNFTGSIPYTIANLMELSYLDFSVNFFFGSIPVFSTSKLAYIDLSRNSLNGSFLSANFEGLSNLSYFNLRYNSLTGSIPRSLFSLPSLKTVLLSNNKFSDQVDEFSTMNSYNLEILDLSSNELQGSIPQSLFKLERLRVLLLSFNFFNGTIELEKLQNLRNLTTLDLSYSNLSVVVRSSINSEMPQFPNLWELSLASCNLHEFPNLMKQTTLTHLDLSKNKITGEIPSWIWEIGLFRLNVSYNFLVDLQKPYNITSLRVLDLHSNKLRGKLPLPPAYAVYVDYSSNNFQETIPLGIGNFISFVSLGNNNLTGVIPTSLCNAIYLEVLDLSGNFLSGGIPPCLLQNIEILGVLNLGRNNISGDIPDTISANCGLKTLDLSKNNLEGRIPTSLANCKSLEVMNVGNNYINDRFPCIMKNSSTLRVLVLRSNKFHGDIRCPGVDYSWPNLQIIDIAFNSFSGNLFPKSIESWKGMTLNNNEQDHLHFKFRILNNVYYQDTVTVTIKAQEMELLKILTVFTSIDFSSNNFEGEIPETIGQLSMLYGLNLSHNSFTGTIPESIGNLTQLESLDLSRNQLTGEIPEKLTRLTFLSFLNLSYNKLVGKIPSGYQFQTFSAESYEGNERLCDFPLNKPCNHDNGQQVTQVKKEEQESSDARFYYISAEVGFAVGLGFIFGPIMFCERWRKCYNKHVDKFVLIIIRKLRSGDNH
ncbi:hypothetical protein RD792_005373 [Penstemon davidsonii]|uniref:Leucine-rich repeat-containing N-terminal plant-type domain-containing protein n=1 Tax=Penstemon davidsonii TaxID=160366 RepID=A0ABR0DLB5_9LAMI|nr:hypothetical protein RD792_005373 [Penstemon davidsonii]